MPKIDQERSVLAVVSSRQHRSHRRKELLAELLAEWTLPHPAVGLDRDIDDGGPGLIGKRF